MDFKVLIADSAIADLKEPIEFVAQHDPEAARRLGEKLVDRALSLASMPQRFAFQDQQRGIRKMPLPPFLIFYTCDEASGIVNILHFWHGARRSPTSEVLTSSRDEPARCRAGGRHDWTRRALAPPCSTQRRASSPRQTPFTTR